VFLQDFDTCEKMSISWFLGTETSRSLKKMRPHASRSAHPLGPQTGLANFDDTRHLHKNGKIYHCCKKSKGNCY
jgi:hypothetical protein